ncbi:MAG: hypothetical protein K1X52_11290 [Pyrinomonadaceae bacterium]|nr:hypothetical protein [Pyrinomonadaceae bacterium]
MPEFAKYICVLLLASLIFCSACETTRRSTQAVESPTRPSNMSDTPSSLANNDQAQNTQQPSSSKFRQDDRAVPQSPSVAPKYLGCWSSGDGNFMSITATTLQTRNSYEPLKYESRADKIAQERGVYLLEILGVDKSHEIAKLIAFKLIGNNEMDGATFDSFEMFQNDQPTARQGRWVREKCITVQKFLK